VDKRKIEGAGRFSCHYPKLAVIITAGSPGRENAMAAAWHTSVSSNPPLYGIAVTSKRLTYALIIESGEFAINFLPLERADLVAAVGGVTGRDVDKFERFGIVKEKALKIAAPVLRDAHACYECKLVSHEPCGDHEWMVGEVVATHWSEEAFADTGTLDISRARPTLYAGSDRYVTMQPESARHLQRGVLDQRSKD
jgi:flavin reductase (DIM6/NTAB) family NADH-FMN oxidoreductase RutF